MKLAKLFVKSLKKLDYLYDMGDSWAHQTSLERLEAAQLGRLYPEFLEGQRRCPPEGCGRIPGYDEFLNVITAPGQGKGSQRKKKPCSGTESLMIQKISEKIKLEKISEK